MSEPMSSQNPLQLLILMGEDKSTQRKKWAPQGFIMFILVKTVCCLQAGQAEVNKQNQFSVSMQLALSLQNNTSFC